MKDNEDICLTGCNIQTGKVKTIDRNMILETITNLSINRNESEAYSEVYNLGWISPLNLHGMSDGILETEIKLYMFPIEYSLLIELSKCENTGFKVYVSTMFKNKSDVNLSEPLFRRSITNFRVGQYIKTGTLEETFSNVIYRYYYSKDLNILIFINYVRKGNDDDYSILGYDTAKELVFLQLPYDFYDCRFKESIKLFNTNISQFFNNIERIAAFDLTEERLYRKRY